MSKINPYVRVLGITLVFLANVELELLAQDVDPNNDATIASPLLGQVPPLPEADEDTLPAQTPPPQLL